MQVYRVSRINVVPVSTLYLFDMCVRVVVSLTLDQIRLGFINARYRTYGYLDFSLPEEFIIDRDLPRHFGLIPAFASIVG